MNDITQEHVTHWTKATAARPQPSTVFQLITDAGPVALVTLGADGSVEYAPGCTPERALRCVAEAMRDEVRARERADAEVERLRAALLKYGDHGHDCAATDFAATREGPRSMGPCSCGFAEAVGEEN